MARQQFWVQWLDELWKVRHNRRTLSSHSVKPSAINAGALVAQTHQPSELFICRVDGTIEDRRTYGDDPYPSRG